MTARLKVPNPGGVRIGDTECDHISKFLWISSVVFRPAPVEDSLQVLDSPKLTINHIYENRQIYYMCMDTDVRTYCRLGGESEVLQCRRNLVISTVSQV
jgi:hypothetical protein